MQSKQKSIKQLKSLLAQGYVPNQEVLSQLAEVTMVPVIGSLASGKTSLLRKIVANDTRFGRVECFTTRARRESDDVDEFRFKSNSEEDLSGLTKSALSGSLVQYMIHPTNDNIYGSEAKDYNSEFALLETIYYAVDDLYKLPFKDIRPIYVVPDTRSWNEQLHKRSVELNPQDVRNRLNEAVKGAEWAIERANTIDWVFNEKGKEEASAAQIVAIGEGQKTTPLIEQTEAFIAQVNDTITLLKS